MPDSFSPIDRLEELVSFVANSHQQKRFESVGHKLESSNPTPFERIEHFVQAMFSGALPDANTMFFVGYALEKYIQGAGGISLEDAFEMKPIQKSGSPAKQVFHHRMMANIMFEIACYRADHPEVSISIAAEEVSLKLDVKEPEAETLASYYTKGRWSRFEKLIPSMQGGK
jgi:hypothetical protein